MPRKALAVSFATVTMAFLGCGDIADNNADNAAKWAEDLGYEVIAAKCGTFDSDDNGYVSCTIRVKDREELIYVECPSITRQIYENNCREQRIGTSRK